jgi:hypothetical protein
MLESDLIIPITNGQRLPPPTHRLESWTVSTAEELVDGESSQTGWVLDQKASPVPLSTCVLLRKCWVSLCSGKSACVDYLDYSTKSTPSSGAILPSYTPGESF